MTIAGKLLFQFFFKDLNVEPDKDFFYDSENIDLIGFLKLFSIIPVEIPYKTSYGLQYFKITNLADVYIPNDVTSKRYVTLKIDMQVMEHLFSIDLGYHRLEKEVVFSCQGCYENINPSQRIYMMLESWLSKGLVIIPTKQFLKLLRLENEFSTYNQCVQGILEPAKKELLGLAMNGYSDCFFSYERKYENDEDSLIFQIYRANDFNKNHEKQTI